jgi:CBS domain-containing protein
MSSTVHIPLDEAGGTVREVMMLEPRSVGPDTPMSEVRDTFASPSVKLMLVTDGERFLGTLGRDDLPAEGDGPIAPHVRSDRPSLRPDDPVDRAMALVHEQGMTRIPVLAEGDRLLGLICFNQSRSAFCVYPT